LDGTFDPGDAGRTTLDITARPLDEVLDAEGIQRVDLLKMDIEGAEAGALRGLGGRLARGAVDRIILELHPAHLVKQGIAPESVVHHVQTFGYDVWRIDHSPAVHRRSASRHIDPGALLTPLGEATALGAWPHLLFVRRGLSR
jgi:hypothetical protein